MTDNTESSTKITSFVGDLEIVGNGTAPCSIESNLKLVFDDLQFEFEFINNKDVNNHSIDSRVVEKKIIFLLTNFNNSLGTGLIRPLEIGHHNGRRLYISFWVVTPNPSEGLRIINWTILKGGNINLTETKNE